MAKFKIAQINIGEDVVYKDGTSTHCGIVIGKIDRSMLVIQKPLTGFSERAIIDISKIEAVLR